MTALQLTAILALGALLPSTAFAVDLPHDTDCATCHSTHGTSYPTLVDQLCEGCHFEGGPAPAVQTHSSRTTDDDYGDWDLDCWACHDPHSQEQDDAYGTSYGMYVRVDLDAQIKEIDPTDPGPWYEAVSTLRTVTSSNVEFTSSTGFVDSDASASDDICQACHESTAFYNTGAELGYHTDFGTDSQPGGDCMSCHPHTEGFAASGCTNCHATEQGDSLERRQVASGGGDFERASHHVTDGTTTEIVADEDCVVCHDQDLHQANTDPAVYLNDPDGGAAWAYDGSGASIEGFCTGCHDADASLAFDSDGDSSDGLQPFTDGRDPTDIATDYASSSHGTTAVTAMADEGCLACHGGTDSTASGATFDRNAHGSHQDDMLSLVVNGTTNTETGAALCLACHEGTTASVDIASMMAGTETYTASSSALVNTRHDVMSGDSSYSGASITCTDCHDPHAASSSQLVVADPDPTDGITPAAGNSWTGSSLMSEWCLDCHDGSVPSTITEPTYALTDISTAYVTDQHGSGIASKRVSHRTGSGYGRGDILECTTCHNPGHGDDTSGTAYPNLFNLRSIIYAADGVTELTPDSEWLAGTNVVRVTDLDPTNTDATTNGRAWCSTCHPSPMGRMKTKGCLNGSCHNHGRSSF